ncbi:MAG: flavodoxin reductase [Hoeflea sp.]|nr:flavodoxin reductase [Hoeflea sp.]
MAHKLAISKIEDVTHDVRQFTFEKPEGFEFTPGQAAEVGIDRDGWRDAGNPFTFTALPGWDELQFTIKIYPEHDGLTEQIGTLKVGDSFIVGEPWGTIEYKGKGTFIAGGAGVTPFIAILRDEFDAMPGLETIHVLSEEDKSGFEHGLVDKAMLERLVGNTAQHFYVCGPDPMIESVNDALKQLGADPHALVFEQ